MLDEARPNGEEKNQLNAEFSPLASNLALVLLVGYALAQGAEQLFYTLRIR